MSVIIFLSNIFIDNLDATEISDMSHVDTAASLLGVNRKSLIEALTTKTVSNHHQFQGSSVYWYGKFNFNCSQIFAHGETVVSTISREQSVDVRDAFSKGIYGRLFIWIVSKINSAIYHPKAGHHTSIGVLDIFGFENFDSNRFVNNF